MAVSCEDPALKEAYGDSLIYMPQAVEGLNITIKSNATSNTTATIGCYRSGLAEKEAFEVQLGVASEALPSNATLLESKYYDALPAKLSVPAGERQASTQLVLHSKEIAAAYPVGKVLYLPVKISNPTKYKLNDDLAVTKVIITIAQ